MSYNMAEVARFFSGTVPMTQSNNSQFQQLYIMSQKTHSEETISKNGMPKHIHLVIKNSPFNLTIGFTNQNSGLDFNKIAFEAFLLYDEGGKEVDFVKVKPVDFKADPSEDGQTLECELRIKVLTSHHEDLLFKVRVQGFNPVTKEEISNVELITFPLKVISKPEQMKKKQTSKKRSLTDMLIETVTRIEKRQEEQQRIIENVLQSQSNLPLPSNLMDISRNRSNYSNSSNMNSNSNSNFSQHGSSFWDNILPESNQSEDKEGKKEVNIDFQEAFANLVKEYNGMTQDEKPSAIRRWIRNSSSRDTERLSELLDLFWTDGLIKEPSSFKSHGSSMSNSNSNSNSNTNSGHSDGCSCIECPHKVELERIDAFYKEFLTSGANLPGF